MSASIGTDAFMDFVESIQAEGVVLERKPMGEGTGPKTPLVVEVDKENVKKDIEALDIEIPVLTPRIYREYKNLADLDVTALVNAKIAYQSFSEDEQREIVFKDHHNRRSHSHNHPRYGRDCRLPQRDRLFYPDDHERIKTGQRL